MTDNQKKMSILLRKIWNDAKADNLQAQRLLAEAKVNEAYLSAMEACGGAERNPLLYAAHFQAAARKRRQADEIRNGKPLHIQKDENMNAV